MSCVLLCPSLLLLLSLCCISAAVGGSVVVLWGPSRHLGSLTAANWVSFDFNVSYSSCWSYSLINTLKLKKKLMIVLGVNRSKIVWVLTRNTYPFPNSYAHTEPTRMYSETGAPREWFRGLTDEDTALLSEQVCIIMYMYLFCLICIYMYTHVYMFIPAVFRSEAS